MNIKIKLASLLLACVLTACSPSTEDITGTLKESLQETLNTDSDYAEYKMNVGNIQLMKLSDGNYKAMADIYLDGETHTVPLDVYVSDDFLDYQVMWEAKPGAFAFVAEKEFEKAMSDFDDEIDKMSDEFEKEMNKLINESFND